MKATALDGLNEKQLHSMVFFHWLHAALCWMSNKPKEFRISNFNNPFTFSCLISVWHFRFIILSYSCVPAEAQQKCSWALMRSSHRQRVPADSSPAPSSCLPTRPLSATWDQHITEIKAVEYRSKNNVLQFKGARICLFYLTRQHHWNKCLCDSAVSVCVL